MLRRTNPSSRDSTKASTKASTEAKYNEDAVRAKELTQSRN